MNVLLLQYGEAYYCIMYFESVSRKDIANGNAYYGIPEHGIFQLDMCIEESLTYLREGRLFRKFTGIMLTHELAFRMIARKSINVSMCWVLMKMIIKLIN